MPIRSWRCTDCSCEYDVLERAGEFVTIDLPDGDDRAVCPSCESQEHESLVTVAFHTDSDSRWYNRWDANLQTHVNDKQHHRAILEERGLRRGSLDSTLDHHKKQVRQRTSFMAEHKADHEKRMATDVDYRKVATEGIEHKRPAKTTVAVTPAGVSNA